jgi:hypothetical protein
MKNMLRALGLSGALALLIAAAPAIAANPSGGGKTRGASAVLAVLDFEGDWTSEYPTLNGSKVGPSACRTGTHLAGPNEVAIVSMGGFVATIPQGAQFLSLRAATSHDGGPFTQLSNFVPSLAAFAGGAAQVNITTRITLDEGVTYAFGGQFWTGDLVVNGFSTCHGTVMIVRLEP